jgi:hypothetical protein
VGRKPPPPTPPAGPPTGPPPYSFPGRARFPRPCLVTRDRPFAVVWADASRRLRAADRVLPTAWERLRREPGCGGVRAAAFTEAWHWEWMHSLFHHCRVVTTEDLGAMVRAARQFEGRTAATDSLARPPTFVEFTRPRPRGRALRGIDVSQHQPVATDEYRTLETGEVLSWANRLLHRASLTSAERDRLSRLDYLYDPAAGGPDSWAGPNFRNYRGHVARAIRDFLRDASLDRGIELPPDLANLEFEPLLDAATGWLAKCRDQERHVTAKKQNRGNHKPRLFGREIFPYCTQLRKKDRNGQRLLWTVVTRRVNERFETQYDPDTLQSECSRERKRRRDKRRAKP